MVRQMVSIKKELIAYGESTLLFLVAPVETILLELTSYNTKQHVTVHPRYQSPIDR